MENEETNEVFSKPTVMRSNGGGKNQGSDTLDEREVMGAEKESSNQVTDV